MFRTWIESLVERLALRMITVVSAKVDAQLELELAAVQSELQTEAERYRGTPGDMASTISKRLDLVAVGLGATANEPLPALAAPGTKAVRKSKETKGTASSNGKKRGRPRKSPEPQLPNEAKEAQP